jgi:hypothetical protein
MNDPIVERRRAPRVSVSPDRPLALGVSFSAQVLEINLAGVLLGATTEMAIGEQAELRATVEDRTLDVAIEIRAVSQETRPRGGRRYRLGATFVGMTVEQRMLLMEWLGMERN